jgi:hypothetical protein
VKLSVNIAPDGRNKDELTGLRFARVRAPLWHEHADAIRSCFANARAHGIGTLAVLDRTSIGADPADWPHQIQWWRDHMGGTVERWQAGNEMDNAHGLSSSTMSPRNFRTLLRMARRGLGSDAYIVAGGLVTGQPSWIEPIVAACAAEVNAFAYHPYGQGTPSYGSPYGEMFGGLHHLHHAYRQVIPADKPIQLTEWGADAFDLGEEKQNEYVDQMMQYLRGLGDPEEVYYFALHGDVAGFGMVRQDGSRRGIYAALDGFARMMNNERRPTPPPPLPPAPPSRRQITAGPNGEWIGSGLLDTINRAGLRPSSGEQQFPGVATDAGMLIWTPGGPKLIRWEGV